ncbi:cyclophane-forming radical SAM/SPASM peptide maturase YhhB [Shewanella sp. 3_MG-2023]|nr:cyclophane-forming radical SAM/SPASM peptide maturase YhhB [Shewanella sp. 3_MG-2023]MDO6776805.1 cyclophane-forming radical SAM/SPASM peptide maturase YhhB [Shewanella sp. 3_MG-2023]
MGIAKFSSFLVKVASRCNLDCDYCYVYHHADQSWRSMPKLLSVEHRELFVHRLQEYILQSGLTRCAVIFHGGEPLLAGAQTIVDFATTLRKACNIPVDVSIQTNGVLLTEESLRLFEKNDIGISLSLDGPKSANDKHRLTRKGRSSFVETEQALIKLQQYPSIFAGVIAVIDVSTSSKELFEYFDQFEIPQLDFLLPDAHWLRPPPNRDQVPTVYQEWLVDAFDIWLDQYPHIKLRTFESLLDVCAGLPSGTDAFGLGDVSLLSIETDGSYHDLDVLKVTQDGATKLTGNLSDTSISEVALSPSIELHRRYLRKEGLADVCQACDIVDICGGGALPHRFNKDGFINPTVYCGEMKRLINHIKIRLKELLSSERGEEASCPLPEKFSLENFELAETSKPSLDSLRDGALAESFKELRAALELINKPIILSELELLASHPGAIAWSKAINAKKQGQLLHSIDGHEVNVSPDYFDFLQSALAKGSVKNTWDVGLNDFWLRAPFGKTIIFEGNELVKAGRELVKQAMDIVKKWRPALATEMTETCRAVQFIRDPMADPRKIVSFSDNSVPGALYISIFQGEGLIDPYDLADSLIHEHRHQKLYLFERYAQTIEPTDKLVVSPWREDLRPPSGLYHAVFVFVELRRFWIYVRDCGPNRLRSRALNQIADSDCRLKQAFDTLEQCQLTQAGQKLADILKLASKENSSNGLVDFHSTDSVIA